jgi:hypothetical protein
MKWIIFHLALLMACVRAENYAVVYDNGSVQTGEEILNSYDWSYSTNAPTIGEAPLGLEGQTIRYIREYARDAELLGPYIRLANGDLLPGSLIGLLPEDEERGLEKRLLIQMSSPCSGFRSNNSEMPVRIDHVAAIVSGVAKDADLPPGTMELKDGTRLTVKSVRWGEDGLKLLTSDGLKRVGFDEIDSYKPASVDRWRALQEDASIRSPKADDRLVQFHLTNGARLTGKRMLLIEVDPHILSIQPAWAYSGIRFDTRRNVVSRSFRTSNELPLSLFPATSLKQQSATGFQWSWAQNQSLRGDELACNELRAGFGFATHSYSEIVVELPPEAHQFTSWVGMDRAVGKGGCVTCAVYGDERGGAPIWKSDFIRGGEEPVRIPPLDVSAFKQLILVTDFGHDDRPAGADPLDIRDELDWLNPTVTLKQSPQVETTKRYARIYAQLPGWEGTEAWAKQTLTGPCVLTWWALYSEGLYLDIQEDTRIKRTFTVSPSNAWLQVVATRGREGTGGHEISLYVNGQFHEPRGWIAKEEEQNVRKWENLLTEKKVAGFLYPMDWDLGRFNGQKVTLELLVHPIRKEGKPLPYLVLEDMRLRSVIYEVNGEEATPIAPDIHLESITPTAVDLFEEGARLQPGKHVNGQPIKVGHFPFPTGIGVPEGSTLTYALDPSWKRFVSIVGYTTVNWAEVGPYEVFFDDQPAWTNTDPIQYHWWHRGTQVDVAIPPGAKTMTLKLAEGNAHGAWALSGFMTQPAAPGGLPSTP